MSFDMGAIGNMMAGVQRIQAEAAEARVEGQAGGGKVKVVATGKQEIVSISISDDVMDDREMLEDLVTAAVNDAMRLSREHLAQKMQAITGGLPLPPGRL